MLFLVSLGKYLLEHFGSG